MKQGQEDDLPDLLTKPKGPSVISKRAMHGLLEHIDIAG